MELNINEVAVKVWAISNPTGAERAIATIKFGSFSISGFRILENNEAHKSDTLYWVAPPAYRTKKGKFQSIFWLADKDLWQKIQEKIIEEYLILLDKKPELRNGLDGIPIIEESDSGYEMHY
ncbi:MAG: septation protein SpoVG family protein [Candidatus Staskawiczbacteria bacterium]|jgi:DNA-binding cell septation regulator SpoVG